MSNAPYDLELTCTFPQTAAQVFAAWTDPEQLAEWWRFPGYSIPSDRVVVETRVGGIWSVTAVSDSDGSEIPFEGEIREIDPNSRLVISLVDEPIPGSETPSSMVVNVRDSADGSVMEFHHLGFGSPDGYEELKGGYTSFFFPSLTAFLADQ